MQLTIKQLTALYGCSTAIAEKYLPHINECMVKYEINTVNRVAAFLAQIGHESGRLQFVEENLNYSATALLRVFGKYFPSQNVAARYARKPPMIANRVYANRMGNGNEASGDGWKYRGRGLIQLTGRNNYKACGTTLMIDLEKDPDWVKTPFGAVVTACWFWDKTKLNAFADKDDIVTISKKINGGTHGLEDRVDLYKKAKTLLA